MGGYNSIGRVFALHVKGYRFKSDYFQVFGLQLSRFISFTTTNNVRMFSSYIYFSKVCSLIRGCYYRLIIHSVNLLLNYVIIL